MVCIARSSSCSTTRETNRKFFLLLFRLFRSRILTHPKDNEWIHLYCRFGGKGCLYVGMRDCIVPSHCLSVSWRELYPGLESAFYRILHVPRPRRQAQVEKRDSCMCRSHGKRALSFLFICCAMCVCVYRYHRWQMME